MFDRPVVENHLGIDVVRDDLYPGGTKSRYLRSIVRDQVECVYASPAEGGAQFAIATLAAELGKKATIFVAKRAEPHPRALQAKALGATVVQVTPGYLSVVKARARAYCEATGAHLIPWGVPDAEDAIASAARLLEPPDEFWCAGGSGCLARALGKAWPAARGRVVQVGHTLTPEDAGGAEIVIYPRPFGSTSGGAPFPSDPHYDAKAWEIATARHGAGRVIFWNVAAPAAI